MDAERLDERHHRRRLAADRRLLDDLRPLPPGRTITLRFRAVLDANLAIGTRVTNTATGLLERPGADGERERLDRRRRHLRASASQRARLARRDFDHAFDANERALAGWTVELYRNDSLAHIARTGATASTA